MPTIVLKCDCQNSFQEGYGQGVRVHNACKDGFEARCTVCGKKKVIRDGGKDIRK